MISKHVNHNHKFLVVLMAALITVAGSADARTPKMVRTIVQSGTGFFVSTSGQVVTNHHVIEGCSEVFLQGAVPLSKGEVMAVDKQYDLALIKAEKRPRRIATIRHPGATKIRMSEPLLVMGYPLDSYKTGEYQIDETTVVGLKGPTEEPHWIQFSDSAQHGNSGGPLLDSSGNVAGVVVGKSELWTQHGRNGRKEIISKSDVAISLPVLMRFLDRHYVAYSFNGSYSLMLSKRVEELAKGYIVNVICEKPEK